MRQSGAAYLYNWDAGQKFTDAVGDAVETSNIGRDIVAAWIAVSGDYTYFRVDLAAAPVEDYNWGTKFGVYIDAVPGYGAPASNYYVPQIPGIDGRIDSTIYAWPNQWQGKYKFWTGSDFSGRSPRRGSSIRKTAEDPRMEIQGQLRQQLHLVRRLDVRRVCRQRQVHLRLPRHPHPQRRLAARLRVARADRSCPEEAPEEVAAGCACFARKERQGRAILPFFSLRLRSGVSSFGEIFTQSCRRICPRSHIDAVTIGFIKSISCSTRGTVDALYVGRYFVPNPTGAAGGTISGIRCKNPEINSNLMDSDVR
jgi:hypothetical protein